MDVNIKVAGTTYHQIPPIGVAILEEYLENNVPCARAEAILLPEPENKFDHEAVKVVLKLRDGSAFHVGYLPKAEPMKTRIRQIVRAEAVLQDYRMVGNYNISIIIKKIQLEG